MGTCRSCWNANAGRGAAPELNLVRGPKGQRETVPEEIGERVGQPMQSCVLGGTLAYTQASVPEDSRTFTRL